jgi:hypothetical protein
MSDGVTLPSKRFLLKQIQIGSFFLENQMAAIEPRIKRPKIGKSMLSSFKTWSVDQEKYYLIVRDK